MQRRCDSCGTTYEAKRRTSRFCSPTCRVRNHTNPVTDLPKSLDDEVAIRSSELVEATRAKLIEVDRVDTYAGQLALIIAGKIGSPMDTGSSTAALSKELSRVMEEALRGSTVAADPIDELRRRREQKRVAG